MAPRWLGRARGALVRVRVRAGRGALVGVILCTLALAGCGAPHGGITAEPNECAVGVPLANAVVGGHGRLVKISPISSEQLAHLPPGAVTTTTASVPASTRRPPVYCVLVFEGNYAPGSVVGTTAGGHYVIVALEVRRPQVVHVAVVDELPPGLCPRHQHCVGG